MQATPSFAIEKTSYAGDRSDIAALVPETARRILDVGCARGELGAGLKLRGDQVQVTGVEMSRPLAELATKRLDEVFVGPIEQVLPGLASAAFDCVIFGDVLEHLIDPYRVLLEVRGKIQPHGVLLASIPNVRHHRIVRKLILRGTWEYGEQGLLDSGHLRFFTLANIRQMFAWAGYETELCGANRVLLRRMWLSRRFLGHPLLQFLDYQYLIRARPFPDFEPPSQPWWRTENCI
jgi:O-antigen biosynthesis protein